MGIYRSSGRVAIQLYTKGEYPEPYATLSVNVDEIPLEEGEFIVKNWSENSDLDQLSRYPDSGFIDTGKRVDVSQFCKNVPVWRIP